ncbi:MAG: histidine ammonia-lyase [delta proteobacterium ML8_F1]|nr:MAG: histidine ammonia-lyase [delta proteobacterium ML8_F1]
MGKVVIDGSSLTLDDIIKVARKGFEVGISDEARERVVFCRKKVDQYVEEDRTIYGITTGFGKFSDINIDHEETKDLQKNLIMSHACGVGDFFEDEVVLTIMLLRANALAKGNSGVRLGTLESLVELINRRVLPRIPEKGSLGASGDLAPLAHMVLTLIGLGEAKYQDEVMDSSSALEKAGLEAVVLTSKEGLALINGTQVLTAVGALALIDGLMLSSLADVSAALSMEALSGITDAFDARVHALRPHPGQMDGAANLLKILEGSKNTTRQGEIRVQDAYSLRCVPQIHGATRDALTHIREKVEIEINAVTDNPIIFPEDDYAISGGNFHGQPMALAFDYLGIALAELANSSERRLERLVNPALSELPAFLTPHGGLNSGFMIVQYTAAALVSENKILAHPASVDSIPSSANQEDHVSMGTIAARKARDILDNSLKVIGLEMLTACQAIDLAGHSEGLGAGTRIAYDMIRNQVKSLEEDRVMYYDINKVVNLIQSHEMFEAVSRQVDLK